MDAIRSRPYLWRLLFWLMRFWPPFFGARIRVHFCSKDLSRLEVRMPLNWINTNFVGVHFGGSLYAMTDPFYMLLLLFRLGPQYVVWDKAAEVRFRKPGRSTVRAVFELSEARLSEIKAQVAAAPEQKCDVHFKVRVEHLDGELVAEVDKTVYIKLKPARGA